MKTVQEHKNAQCTMNNVQWKKVKLGNCCAVNPKTDTTKVLDDDVVTLVRMEDVSNDGFITSFSERTYKSLQKRGLTIFQNEDVIFAKITPCMENGKGALVRNMKSKICMGSTEFHVLRACDNVSIDFIYQLTISKRFRQRAEMQMTGSAGQQRVPTAFLEDCLISIPFKNNKPDLPAQRRIAAILASADKVIDSTRRLIEKYKKMKQGMMEELFNEQCTMNNVQWKKVRLGEVGDFYVGGDVDRSCFSPYPTVECRFPIYANALVNEGLYGYSNKYEFDKEAVTITGRGDVGKVFYRKPYFSTIIRLVTLIPTDSNIDVKFLSYAMLRINFIIESTGVPQLTAPQAKKYEVSIPYKNGNPDLAEQRRIAAILSGIDAKIAAEEKVLEKYTLVKKGLMEKLLNE